MRTFAGFCLTATLIAAPAFAQTADGQVAAAPSGETLSSGSAANAATPAESADQMKFSLGIIDRLSIKRGTDRLGLPISPIETEQLALSWRPGGKWGLTLDLTSRSQNDLSLPKEELSAGAYYQMTPRFRFGGGLTLNGNDLRSAANNWADNKDKAQAEAGVRIESAFSF
jgi:hypothetical protein